MLITTFILKTKKNTKIIIKNVKILKGNLKLNPTEIVKQMEL